MGVVAVGIHRVVAVGIHRVVVGVYDRSTIVQEYMLWCSMLCLQ